MQSRFRLLINALLVTFYANLTAFHPHTLIKTEIGFVKTNDIQIGQLLSDKNKVVTKLHAHRSTITIRTQNSIITCAPHQQFLTTSDQSWHFAKDLQPGDFIESFSGIPVQIQSIESSPTKTRFCYLTVLPDHTLIVGPDELIAHNHSAETITVFLAAMPTVTVTTAWAPPVAMTATAITFAWFAITKGPELAITIAHSCVYAWELLKTCGTALLDRWHLRGQERGSCGSPEFTQELHGCGTGKLSDPLFEKDPIACSPDLRSVESIGCNYGIQTIPVTQEEIDKGVVIFQPFRPAECTEQMAQEKNNTQIEKGKLRNNLPKIRKIKELFDLPFGTEIKKKCKQNGHKHGCGAVYEMTDDYPPHLSKGDRFYLDKLHGTEIEVYTARGKAKMVINTDGTKNEAKSEKAIKEKRTLY